MHDEILELRQYTLHPGQRDALIALFDRELVETQEAEGMDVLGQFRDEGDPDRFVWLRGFSDLSSRRRGLAAFYGGPVWAAHRAAANATMVSFDNVLLLRRARPTSGFTLDRARRRPPGARDEACGMVVAAIGPDDVDAFERSLAPALAAAGAQLLAYFVTEPSVNDFPALPVREGEDVLVWFAQVADRDVAARVAALASGAQILRLTPTARSLVRG